MKQIRRNVFETNSSSTHSLTMCMASDYDAWANGEVYFNDGWWHSCDSIYKNKRFVTKEEAIDIFMHSKYASKHDLTILNEDEVDDYLRDFEFYTYDNYQSEYLEWFDSSYTTPSGEKVVCFGQFGYDG